MKNGIRNTIFIVAILISLLAVWAIYKTLNVRQSTFEGQDTSTKTIKQDSTITTDETTKEKVYINRTFGFSLKVPSSWDIDERAMDVTPDGLPKFGTALQIGAFDDTPGSLMIWINNKDFGECPKTKDRITVLDVERKKCYFPTPGVDTYDVPVPAGDLFYNFQCYLGYDNKEAIEKLCDEIVSSFEVTNR